MFKILEVHLIFTYFKLNQLSLNLSTMFRSEEGKESNFINLIQLIMGIYLGMYQLTKMTIIWLKIVLQLES